MTLISLKGVSKSYVMGPTRLAALKQIDLTIESGEFVAIMGASGSGKSTLLHILGLLDVPETGIYQLGDDNISTLSDEALADLRNQKLGFVFQQFHLLSGINALDNVQMPRVYSLRGGDDKNDAIAKLTAVGLKDRVHHLPNELSGGERQRVAIARALINDPILVLADEPTGNLDTKSEEEIMAILESLNAEGITIVMVTHEMEIAARAKRIITMRDGNILSDVVKSKSVKKSPQIVSPPTPIKTMFVAQIWEDIRQAFRSIGVNKTRSFLSMLGIFIGVGAVITMLALGTGATNAIKKDLSTLGSNLLIVRSGASHNQGVSMGVGSGTELSILDSARLQKLPTVKTVSAIVSGRAQVVNGNKNWNTQVQGVEPSYANIHYESIPQGRFFNADENSQRERVAIIGLTVATQLFGTESPLGRTIKINRNSFRVIGLLPAKGFSMGRDGDDQIIIPIHTAMYRLLGSDHIGSLEVEIKSEDLLAISKTTITNTLKKAYRIPADNEDFLDIRDLSEIQKAIKSTVGTMSALLGAVAAISLIVGGIGIMNIMLVSVAERTREIGIRKALGATKKSIQSQFLVEAIILTLLGGILGIILGEGISQILKLFTGWPMQIGLNSVIVATVFPTLIGLFFGYYPARQAARLNTIDALRYE